MTKRSEAIEAAARRVVERSETYLADRIGPPLAPPVDDGLLLAVAEARDAVAHVKLTEQQKIAACVFFGLACLAWTGRDATTWWYKWTTDRSHAARDRDPFESACWWAIRFADETDVESAEQWLAYVTYVFDYRGRARR